MQRSCLFFAALLWVQAKFAGKSLAHPLHVFTLALVTDFLLSKSNHQRKLNRVASNKVDDKQPALLAIDLDGTLLDRKSLVSDRSKQALKAFVQATNGFVVFATGQPARVAKKVQDQIMDLNLNAYFIVSGGALCMHGPSWGVRKEFAIPKDCVSSLLQAALKEIPDFYVSIETKSHWLVSDEGYFQLVDTTMPGMGTKLKRLGTVVGGKEIHAALDTPEFASNALRIILLHKIKPAGESMDKLAPMLQNFMETTGVDLEVKHAGVPTGVEILPKNVDKGSAVEAVCQELDVPPESVVAFGDQMNDLRLLKWAGTGIAMKNGDEKVKQACEYVTEKSNDEDGVAVEIEKLMNTIDIKVALKENAARLHEIKRNLENEKSTLVEKINNVHKALLSALKTTAQ